MLSINESCFFTQHLKESKMENSVIQFEVGKTYVMSWIGDSDLKTKYTVVSRTEKTVILKGANEKKEARFRCSFYKGVEQVSPSGKYSMSPILSADRPELADQLRGAQADSVFVDEAKEVFKYDISEDKRYHLLNGTFKYEEPKEDVSFTMGQDDNLYITGTGLNQPTKSKDLGITKGEWIFKEWNGRAVFEHPNMDLWNEVTDSKFPSRQEVRNNARLIGDAAKTANECGLLPSELLDQRNELLSALKGMLHYTQNVREISRLEEKRQDWAYDKIEKLLTVNRGLIETALKVAGISREEYEISGIIIKS